MARQERLCGDRRQGSSAIRCSTAGRPGTRSSIASTACSSSSTRTWRAAFCRALNDWIAKEWLDRDPRLRASIVMPMQNVEYAVDEIERCAKDKRFVQVLVLAMQEVPLGRRHYLADLCRRRAPRPADRHPCRLGLSQSGDRRSAGRPGTSRTMPPVAGLPVAGREPDHRGRVRQASRAEGGADRIGRDLAAAASCGVSTSSGAGLRTEVPWVDRSPWEIVRDHFRLTIQPFDAPDDPDDGGTGHRTSAFR